MSTITWLHLSDLHFRQDRQAKWDEDIVLRKLLEDVRERIECDRLGPDFVVVTGDIAFGGAAKEYALASQFLDEVLDATGLGKDRLFVVPGNHDVDWSLISRGAKGIASSLDSRKAINEVLASAEDRRLLFRRFDQYRRFTRDYFAGQRPFDSDQYFHVSQCDAGDHRIALLGLNSAWLCAGDEDQNHLALGERQVRSALGQAKDADLKIALMHHPFDWLLDCDRKDCEPLLTQNCDFVLHGHLHRSGVTSLATPDADAMVIAAGACYETRESRNAYNVVHLDLDTGRGTIFLRRYSDDSGGFWTEDVMTYRNAKNGRYDFTLPGRSQRPAGEQTPPAEPVATGAGAPRGTRGDRPGRQDLRAATKLYLSHLVDRYRYLDFKGMGVSDRVPLQLPLVEMYVPLNARIELPEGETWDRGLRLAGKPVTEEEAEAVGRRLGALAPVLDMLEDNDGLIVLGDPGAGKTTFLKYLALRLAMGQGQDLGLGPRLPVLAPLSAYAAALAEVDVPLDRFIAQYYRNRGLGLPMDSMLDEALAEGRGLLLLDGLDEVRDWGRRRLVVDRVVDFFTVHRRQGNKFILTSRIVGYREVRPVVEGLAECTLVDFDDDEIEEFVGKWTAALERAARGDTAVAAEEAQRERDELLDAVRRNPGVRTLASNPLLLTILALMKRQGVTLPERRVELYEKYIETLLKNWNLARGLGGRTGRDLDVVETVRVLAPLARWMHETSPGVGLVKREDVRRTLEEIYANRGADDPEKAGRQLLEDVHDHAGLLLERGPGEYGFIHLTFQEYLAAVAVAQTGQTDVAPVVEALASHVGDDNWREVTLLAVGHLGLIQQRDEAAGQVVTQLADAELGEPGEAATLAGDAVVDAWPGGVNQDSKASVVQRLSAIMVDDATVEPTFRAAAGATLAKLGDPRPEATTIEGMQFCCVPGGPFWMGEDKQEHLYKGLEQPYSIGRYPVTNAQFREFVEAGGYGEERYWPEAKEAGLWADAGFRVPPERHPLRQILPKEQLKNASWQIYVDQEPRVQPYDHGEPYCLPTHPVVWVTWYECLAFTRWLTGRLHEAGVLPNDWRVALPSEAEWEKAARGGKQIPSTPLMATPGDLLADQVPADLRRNARPKRAYPWGRSSKSDEADPNRANYTETKIESTSAVGCFPGGASPYGCEDMAGNVWEWTRSLWGRDWQKSEFAYPYDPAHGRDNTDAPEETRRVLRGSAFYNFPELTRVAARYWYDPYVRNYDVGCRLVAVPILSSDL